MSGLSSRQIEVLLQPINPRRVGNKQGQSHVEAYDIRAHLNRMFGFGNWDFQQRETTLLFDDERTLKNGKPGRYVAYRVSIRISIRDHEGDEVAFYDGTAVGAASMPEYMRAEAHDMAVKTAESQALKRAAINLGDQFGLSLYNGGSTQALVRKVVGVDDENLVEDSPEIAPEVHDVAIAHDEEVAQGEAQPAYETVTEMITKAQIAKLATVLGKMGRTGRDERIEKINEVLLVNQLSEVESSKELTKDTAGIVIDALEAELRG